MIKILIILLLMIGNAYSDNGQVSPVAALDQPNTSVINNNFQNVQNGVNGIFGLFSRYFTNGYVNVSSGGTGTSSINWTSGSIPYMSSTGVWGNIGIGTVGYELQVIAGPKPAWVPNTQNIATYNTTAPLTTIYEDDTNKVSFNSTDIGNRTSIFGRSGTVNVSFTAKALNGGATGSAYIRKNGTQIGTTRTLNSGYQTFSENIAVVSGDYLDLYFATCSNNCATNGFIISAGNVSPEKSVSTDGTTTLSPVWKFGTGSPATNLISCNEGDLYSRLDGASAITVLYVCTSLNTWTAK